jgi:hypothetical protein
MNHGKLYWNRKRLKKLEWKWATGPFVFVEGTGSIELIIPFCFYSTEEYKDVLVAEAIKKQLGKEGIPMDKVVTDWNIHMSFQIFYIDYTLQTKLPCDYLQFLMWSKQLRKL